MITLANPLESNRDAQAASLSVVAALHLALFVWNPVLFRDAWKTLTSLGDDTVVVIELRVPPIAVSPGPVTVQQTLRVVPVKPAPVTPRPALVSRSFSAIRMPELPIKPQMGLSGDAAVEAPIALASSRPMPQGASIEGPLSNRAVLHKVIPEYPAWAEEQGIMGTVRIYFSVTRDGRISSTLRVDRTSGYPELDRLAMAALQQWRFAPSGSEGGSQWGIITFMFSLAR